MKSHVEHHALIVSPVPAGKRASYSVTHLTQACADVGLEPPPSDSTAAHVRGTGRTLRCEGAHQQQLLILVWILRSGWQYPDCLEEYPKYPPVINEQNRIACEAVPLLSLYICKHQHISLSMESASPRRPPLILHLSCELITVGTTIRIG